MIETGDIDYLLEHILQRYGYDFSGYSKASMIRRVNAFYAKQKHVSFMEMSTRLMKDTPYFMFFIEEVTVNVTEMFRDAGFYKTLRENIVPVLATYPVIRIWHAGCSTGEEVYSLAILLKEANLLHKAILYATDLNQGVLEKAKTGMFPIHSMQQNTENYIKSGGKGDFSTYYHAGNNGVQFDKALSKRMVFSTHNLVADSSFNEFQLILCRNVLIYFDKALQDRVLHLFDKSLESLGFLALGNKESLRFFDIADNYKQLENKEKIWRKIR